MVKLIDYRNAWAELERSKNPFAIAVQAFLKTLETRGDEQGRYSWKKAFLLALYERGLTRETIFAFCKFINWVMALPEALDDVIVTEMIQYRGERADAGDDQCGEIGVEAGA